MGFKTPVLLITFNRPDKVEKMLKALKRVKPENLYVAADAPRDGNNSDKDGCRKNQELIEQIDWPCNIRKLRQKKNLGCKYGPITAINWFFDNVDAGIILEDDCLPEPSFFPFCEELLEKYRDDDRVGVLNGENHLDSKDDMETSYYFSRVNHCWGWATWKRVWDKFEPELDSWKDVKLSGGIGQFLSDPKAVSFWNEVFEDIYQKDKVDIWDYQWNYTCIVNNYLTIVPSVNLITNIGFDDEATHTLIDDSIGGVAAENLGFPLIHPTNVTVESKYDKIVQQKLFYYPSDFRKFYWKLRRVIKKITGKIFKSEE